MTTSTQRTVTPSSGNVFADLGFADPDGEQLKADLVILIRDEAERRGLSQTQLAQVVGLSQPDISRVLRGRLGGFSLHRLLGLVRSLGMDVEIAIRPSSAGVAGRQTLRVG